MGLAFSLDSDWRTTTATGIEMDRIDWTRLGPMQTLERASSMRHGSPHATQRTTCLLVRYLRRRIMVGSP
jgi:hypothetical protein